MQPLQTAHPPLVVHVYLASIVSIAHRISRWAVASQPDSNILQCYTMAQSNGNPMAHPVSQAPEPLYLAAQLVRDSGLQGRQLPKFSYGRSATASTGPGAVFADADADADAFPLLPAGRSFRTEAVDEIGSAAVRALLQSGDADAFDDVPGQLRRLACAFERPRGAPPPPAGMGRRVRRRSCDEAAMHCDTLSLVAC